MPEVRGTALAASLPEPRPFIVFATAYDSYALDAIARRRHRLPAEAGVARQAGRHARPRALAAGASRAISSATWPRRRRCRRRCGPARCRRSPGFDCAAASLPARGVGGDFYDALRRSAARTWGAAARRRLGQGHGGRPGRLGRAGARAHARPGSRASTPAALMAAVDRDVYATTDGARYATAIYATLDAGDAPLHARQRRPSGGAGRRPATGAIARVHRRTGPGAGLDRGRRVRGRTTSRLPPAACSWPTPTA